MIISRMANDNQIINIEAYALIFEYWLQFYENPV